MPPIMIRRNTIIPTTTTLGMYINCWKFFHSFGRNIRKNLTYATNDDKKEAQIEHHIKDGVQFEDLSTGPLVKGGVHSHL
jgi:hypothetical protein